MVRILPDCLPTLGAFYLTLPYLTYGVLRTPVPTVRYLIESMTGGKGKRGGGFLNEALVGWEGSWTDT